ncbi:MAG: MarR family transcriptional regulator [Burkholderiales bacterium]|nr:MarR family transcriptional regulator [Burkholderiales bacterium]
MNEHYERGTLRLLRYIYNQMERCRNLDFGNLDITSSQASVMLFLFKNRSQQVTQQNVQTALMLSHPTITGLMQRLETKGFIQRISDPQDGRCKAVELTPKGEEIEKALKNNTRAMEQRALNGLTTQELTILDYCLRTIAENLRQSEEESNVKATASSMTSKTQQQKTTARQRAPRM